MKSRIGSISDDSGRMQLVDFSDAKRHKLENIFLQKGSVKIKDFRVQEGESSLEVVIGDNTIIESSEKKFRL